MEEGHVTVDGVTHAIPSPFLVIAKQNPFGSAGTQLLPESQIDRFMVCVEMGYPTLEDEIRIVKGRERGSLVETVQVVSSAEEILRMQDETEQIHLEESMYRYISEIVRATRDNPLVQLGISPRGSIALTRMTKAVAYLRGRDYGIPADVQEIVSDTLSHRLRLSARAKAEELSVQTVMERIAGSVTAPSLRTRV
jgi:MoxR-like ATPase